MFDPQGPLRFIRSNNGPQRGMGHFRMLWDANLQNQVGNSVCGNGGNQPCPIIGTVRHKGMPGTGLPLTAVGDVVGPVGGFGWILELNQGSPRNIRFETIEVLPETILLLSLPYPPETTFRIAAHAAPWCSTTNVAYSCVQYYEQVDSINQVRDGPGNQYHVDSNGVVTFRIVQTPKNFVGRPEWFIPTRDDPGVGGRGFAVERVERSGVYLPRATYGPFLSLEATCGGSGSYCSGTVAPYNPNPCPSGFTIQAYDRCCFSTNPSSCIYSNGLTVLETSQKIEEQSFAGQLTVPPVALVCFLLLLLVP